MAVSIVARPWCQALHAAGPGINVMIDMATRGPDGTCIELATIRGATPEQIDGVLAGHPDVVSHELVERTRHFTQVRLAFRGCPLAELLAGHSIVPRLPFSTLPGHDLWIIVGQRRALDEARRRLADKGSRMEILHERDWSELRHGLTPKQQEVLRRAAEQGYYDYPRRITLSALAGHLGIAKSTLSESLMVIEKKLVRHHVVTKEPAPRAEPEPPSAEDEDGDRAPPIPT